MNNTITKNSYVKSIITSADDVLDKWSEVVLEDPTNIGKEDIVSHLVEKYGKTLFISQSYDINRQWNNHPEIMKDTVFMTYSMFSNINHEDIYDFCTPYKLIILDEAHHTGAKGYFPNIMRIIGQSERKAKVFGITTHTRRYSDNAEDVAETVFNGHKITGITFEDAIRNGLLPQFDYVSALYSMPKDIDDLVSASSLAKQIISDNGLIQINEDGIKEIIRKHMPEGNRKVIYFVPSIEDSEDAEKLASELGYGNVYAINYTKSDKDNVDALKAYNNADMASLICISKFNEGAIPEGTNTVVILRRTTTINIFERQVLTALWSAKEKPVVYDFVSTIDSLIYSRKEDDTDDKTYYTERVKSLCSQSIVVDYTRQWTSVFNKLRELSQRGWTEQQDKILARYYPKYGEDVYRYIKGHNKKECVLRAEVLGIIYEPPKIEPEKEENTKPYTFSMENIKNDPSFGGIISVRYIKEFCRAYMQTLDTGRVPDNLIRVIETKDPKRMDATLELLKICTRATEIADENSAIISKRQAIFADYINGYSMSYDKKTTNIVVLKGKALQGDDVAKEMARFTDEKSKENKVLIEGHYFGKKSAIAGLYGDTLIEHILYKTYWRLLMDNYKTDNVSQFMKEFSPEDVQKKIDNLRNRRTPWTEEDIEKLKVCARGNNTYPALLRAHSDTDVAEKALEVGNAYLAGYSRTRTEHFEKNFRAFMESYEEKFDRAKAEEDRKLKQQQIEEENREKRKKEKKRLKNLKPTVVIVSKK